MPQLIQITLPYACAGIVVESPHLEARCIRAAPIFGWMLGKTLRQIEVWVLSKHGVLQGVGETFI